MQNLNATHCKMLDMMELTSNIFSKAKLSISIPSLPMKIDRTFPSFEGKLHLYENEYVVCCFAHNETKQRNYLKAKMP